MACFRLKITKIPSEQSLPLTKIDGMTIYDNFLNIIYDEYNDLYIEPTWNKVQNFEGYL